MRLGLAIKAFFRVLGNAAAASRVADALSSDTTSAASAKSATPALAAPAPAPAPVKETPKPPARSEALTLLAALQREARFVDLVQESLDAYTDAQIGGAARDVLRDCRKTLDRMFALKPLHDQDESVPVDVPAGYDANRFRVTGNVAGEPPFRGKLVHHGWLATQCQLPVWTGAADAARIVAPAEVEV